MPTTTGRATGTYQSFTGSNWETLFDSTLHGSPCSIFEVFAAGDDVDVRVTAKPQVHNTVISGSADHATFRVTAGSSQPFGSRTPAGIGGITKVEAKQVSGSSTVKGTVVAG